SLVPGFSARDAVAGCTRAAAATSRSVAGRSDKAMTLLFRNLRLVKTRTLDVPVSPLTVQRGQTPGQDIAAGRCGRQPRRSLPEDTGVPGPSTTLFTLHHLPRRVHQSPRLAEMTITHERSRRPGIPAAASTGERVVRDQ